MDLPVGPDYVVGPGDSLSVDMWGGITMRLNRTVDNEGRISLPDVGPIFVNGRTLGDVQRTSSRFCGHSTRTFPRTFLLRACAAYAFTWSARCGGRAPYDISSLSTPLNALFSADGPTAQGSLRILKHMRGNQMIQEVDTYDLLLRGVRTEIKSMQNGDTILVPAVGPQVTVEGMVRRPAVYELKNEENLSQVIALAGGMLPTAALRHIEVQRLVIHEQQTMLSLDIPDGDDSDAAKVTKQMEAFKVQDGDRIRLFPIAPYNQNAVYLEGHVLRPGRYSYRDGMTLTDIVGSYKDLLPEPAGNYAEIIRLNPPDFRPTVESFDLAAVLSNKIPARPSSPWIPCRFSGSMILKTLRQFPCGVMYAIPAFTAPPAGSISPTPSMLPAAWRLTRP